MEGQIFHVMDLYLYLYVAPLYVLSLTIRRGDNKLEILKRRPSDLRRYLSWTRDTKAQYGSMTNYLIKNRLPWGEPPFTYTSSTPFAEPDDYRILLNDWPYGMTSDVTQ